ncbi:TPA: plasmid segregation protein ParR [Staphylococcus aureus]|uniref:plasmid segregation protein ParR n=1 Tax=Staphylococcus aureus TaxID=1280 RepID=UPI000DA9B884|nr:plasmid segregation protein ParR [Staphylococcus aureus]PZK24813.1 plasmid segregation protein ParR [Staphylococcus aureus]HCY8173579.1 plasmid segregation protein ParR [Staphylococcus aureus]
MDKKETQHLLKIKKQDYPQIFNFLEGLPKGTKTAHIREALMRYIAEEGNTPRIPTKSYENSSNEHISHNKITEPVKESYQSYIQRQNQSSNDINSALDDTKNEKDEELVELDIDNI